MKKQSVVTTYVVYLDDYYRGPIKAQKIAKLKSLIGINGIIYNTGYNSLIITAANNALNEAEIDNLLITYFDEHYTLEKIGELTLVKL